MKKIILLLLLLTGLLMAQFEAGTVSVGSLMSYSSYKASNDDDDPLIVTSIGSTQSILTVKPNLSFFILRNLSIDGILGFTLQNEGNSELSRKIFGGGATFYLGNIYFGGGILEMSSDYGDHDTSSNYAELHGGYLLGMVKNVFLDFGVSNLIGIGEIKYNNDDTGIENKDMVVHLNVGIRAFMHK